MKLLSQQKALERLQKLKSDLKTEVAQGYEYRAKDCLTCETQGVCCLDAHFVNVHISRLEAAAITSAIKAMPPERRGEIDARVDSAIETYGLDTNGDTYTQTYACPLFEKGTGCLVHKTGKPVPCIMHACYENPDHLPPDEMQTRAEKHIDDLNARAYGRADPLLPLPLALRLRR